MTVRRRSRRRPLTEFAKRSPLHALIVWLLKSGLIALLLLGLWLLITTWAVPSLSESLTR